MDDAMPMDDAFIAINEPGLDLRQLQPHPLDSLLRPIGILLGSAGEPLYLASGWPAVVWACAVPADVRLADTVVDDVTSLNPDLLLADRTPLLNVQTSRPLSLRRARRLAQYMCERPPVAGGVVDGIFDAAGAVVSEIAGRVAVIMPPKEYVRGPDGKRVLDVAGRPISLSNAQRKLGIPTLLLLRFSLRLYARACQADGAIKH